MYFSGKGLIFGVDILKKEFVFVDFVLKKDHGWELIRFCEGQLQIFDELQVYFLLLFYRLYDLIQSVLKLTFTKLMLWHFLLKHFADNQTINKNELIMTLIYLSYYRLISLFYILTLTLTMHFLKRELIKIADFNY